MENTKIEWCDHTTNLWWGCTKVHQGCDNCYAERLAARFGTEWGDNPRKLISSAFDDLDKYNRKAKKQGKPASVFVGSMMDVFEKPMPVVAHNKKVDFTTNDIRSFFFSTIFAGHWNYLHFLLLTKRPSNINKYIPDHWILNPPANIMYGASVVDNKSALDVKRHLAQVTGTKFLSVEPQLEFIDFSKDGLLDGIAWVIQGGESGPARRYFNPEWARHTRDVCKEKGIPYFFKQIDKVQGIPEDLMIREFPNCLNKVK